VDKDAPKEILLGNDVNVVLKAGDVGLLLSGPKVTIKAKSDRRPTIRFNHDAPPQEGPKPWAAVSIESPDVTVSGVRVLVDGQNAEVAVVGLRLRGPAGASFTVDKCEFIQARPGAGQKRLTSLAAVAADAAPANLTLTACRFLSFADFRGAGLDGETLLNGPFGGGDAVLRDGPVAVKASDCAFGPHAAEFRLEGGKDGSPARLALNHCSVLLAGPSAVFDARAGAAAALDVQACLFSHPDGASAGAAPAEWAALIRQADPDDKVTYTDRDNRYHGLNGYWMIGNDDDQATWDEFQNRAVVKAPASLVLTDSPWKNDPLQPFRGYNFAREDRADDHFLDAFQIKESQPNLRVSAPPSDKGIMPVGVEKLDGASTTYVARLKEADQQAAAALKKQRFVDPSKDSDSANRTYKTLTEALAASLPGDEILLRWDGEQQVTPNRLGGENLQDVTIRPDEKYHPQLVLVEDKDRDPEPALFRVFNGRLTLEGLEFVLRPGNGSGRQALIDLVGQGQCVLRNCVVTLNPAGLAAERVSAVVWLPNPGKAMMMPAAPADPPQLTFDGCFVRGDGDLVACEVGRPFALTASNTLAALRGCFLSVDAGPAGGATAPTGPMTLTLNRVTTYLTGNLIHLRAGKDSSLTPVHCAPADCLFVAAKDAQPLIHIDNSDMEERALEDAIQWVGVRTAVYGNYGTMLDQTPPGEDMMPQAIGPKKWAVAWDAKNPVKEPVKNFHFNGQTPPPSADGPFGGAAPPAFRPQDPSVGADVDKLSQLLPAMPK
jgi:hypothetical protein